jgi:hypothetical protein
MDPRDRADAALARASARSRWVVTPNNATSPMDAKPTVQIPRVVVDAAEPDPDTTIVLPGNVAAGQVPVPPQQHQHQPPRPPQQQQQQPPRPPQQQQPHQQETKQLPGIIPTTQQTPGRRISLTDRLSGALPENDQT